ncbi:hypothetical protein CERSUDRAFT_81174 [Gelatoporia subvermispora B]|uniref:DUF6534 domain-containing protein n=1 Tax=Ceriporiopsis subvermispora (strain B) TaxID=914234 RepID=M2RMY1_CERS8|nr:hypothetical protein CERSUDRAFT_81174 [Gelatoporia subvermispora B]
MAGPNLHLDDTVGCLFIGVALSLIFFSCTIAQTVFYYRNYPKDSIYLKALVASLSVLDVITLVLNLEYLGVCTVSRHANPVALESLPNFWVPEFFFSSLTFCTAQLFFIHKIWALLGDQKIRLPLTLIAIILSLVSFAGGIGVVCVASLNPSVDWILERVKIPGSTQQLTAVVTDVYITISLCIILRSSQASFKNTQTLLSQLTVYVINRGVLSATIQLLHFVTYVATYNRFTFIWMVFHIPGSKVYVNSVLATLNIRHKLRNTGFSNGQSSLSFPTIPEPSIGFVRPSTTLESTAQGGV